MAQVRVTKSPRQDRTASMERWRPLLIGVFGLLLGFSFLVARNVIILDPPDSGYVLALGLVIAGGLALDLRRARRFHWIAILPLVWFGWQCISATRTLNPDLTRLTLVHFAVIVACFYFGFATLAQTPSRIVWFLIPIFLFFAIVLARGFQQYYWEFAQDRRYIQEQEVMGWTNEPPEALEEKVRTQFLLPAGDGRYTINPLILQRLEKHRIFGTLMYPNSLAGAILLLTPPLLVAGCSLTARVGGMARTLFAGLFLWAALACLYWSGSKAGWLVALGVVVAALWDRPFPKRWKYGVAIAVIVGGLAAFFVKFAPYFERGATSVSARFDYWRAAWITAAENPIVGTGPGTFQIAYSKIKPPEAEMARLVHNDYLEQASDSGFVGFAAYAVMVAGGMWLAYRHRAGQGPLYVAIWLGLFGWFTHGLVEFSLYIPALAWPAFTLFGFVLARALHRTGVAVSETPR